MNRVFQTIFGADEGNCFAACLASLFPVDLDSIPDFEKVYGSAWYEEFTHWCDRFDVVPLMFNAEHHTPHLPVYYLMGGISSRDVPHSVVGFKGEMVHDPYPGGFGLVKVEDYTYFVKAFRGELP